MVKSERNHKLLCIFFDELEFNTLDFKTVLDNTSSISHNSESDSMSPHRMADLTIFIAR